MKKRNIIAIMMSLATVLTMFAACGNNDKEDVTNPTVVGTDGKVYEELTEAVTDAEGEAVTDAVGETQTVVVTKPYIPPTTKAEEKKDKDDKKDKDEQTQAPDANPGTTADPGTPTVPESPFPGLNQPEGEVVTDPVEDVTFPEGEKVDIALTPEGEPQQSMKDKIFLEASKNQALHIDGTVVISDKQVVEAGMPVKFYIKGNDKFAIDLPLGLATLRWAYDGKTMNIILPKTKQYLPGGTAEGSGSEVVDEMGIWSSLSSDSMTYVDTTRVKVKGTEYICETYKDESGSMGKYYFTDRGELKRMEIITPDGASTIFKVSAIATTVDDSVFSVPGGYEQLSEEAFAGIAGSLGLQ